MLVFSVLAVEPSALLTVPGYSLDFSTHRYRVSQDCPVQRVALSACLDVLVLAGLAGWISSQALIEMWSHPSFEEAILMGISNQGFRRARRGLISDICLELGHLQAA